MPTAKNEDDKRPKLGPRLVPGIFVGYKLYPGGIWREEYLVFDNAIWSAYYRSRH